MMTVEVWDTNSDKLEVSSNRDVLELSALKEGEVTTLQFSKEAVSCLVLCLQVWLASVQTTELPKHPIK